MHLVPGGDLISYWAILGEIDWWPVMVILTRVNVDGVNNFAVGPLDGFTNLFIQPPASHN